MATLSTSHQPDFLFCFKVQDVKSIAKETELGLERSWFTNVRRWFKQIFKTCWTAIPLDLELIFFLSLLGTLLLPLLEFIIFITEILN